jgi:hypothetical protein
MDAQRNPGKIAGFTGAIITGDHILYAIPYSAGISRCDIVAVSRCIIVTVRTGQTVVLQRKTIDHLPGLVQLFAGLTSLPLFNLRGEGQQQPAEYQTRDQHHDGEFHEGKSLILPVVCGDHDRT